MSCGNTIQAETIAEGVVQGSDKVYEWNYI